MKKIFVYTCLLLLTALCACKKDSFITSKDAQISLSADSLHFDTVFTTTGSVTQQFKIKNSNNQKLKINSVYLGGGTSSSFKINVDGVPGPTVGEIDLDANDSIFVFVTVTINPNAANQPFVLRDSIGVDYNGNKTFVQLEAWGQNAHFLRNTKISGNIVWTNDLPYVILGGLQVDTTASLTIQKGCKIYLHADAPLLVDGSLQVTGEKFDSTRVYFASDRLDYPYNEYPAGWPGIYFRPTSKNNSLQYAVVRNAYQGLIAQGPSINANSKLVINQCIVDNIYDAGIYGIETSINATNCLISNCGKNVQLVLGGNYQFVHCTMPTIGNNYITHKDPALYISNYVQSGSSVYTDNLFATFTNCIIWADNSTADNEVVTSRQGSGTFNVNFQNCLWKVKTNPSDVVASNIISNQAPAFDSINVSKSFYSFRLKDVSPAINKGITTSVNIDLDGKPRPVGLPDLGAYEKQ
ncbi:MAG: choice-of-anchor Q domain-containing protein [Chitinophagaceae bacterium]